MRKKPPAYGKRLLEQRRAGQHPREIELIYGDRWKEGRHPFVAIEPKDYNAGIYDLHVLAGTRVTVVDQLGEGFDVDENAYPPRWGKFYDLLGEVAANRAVVMIRWPKGVEPRTELLLDFVDRRGRWFNRETRLHEWPKWWGDELHKLQIDAARAWLEDAERIENGRAAA